MYWGDWSHLKSSAQFFAEPDHPLLHEYDGYYYLRHARDVVNGAYGTGDQFRSHGRPATPAALSLLAAGSAMATGVQPDLTAFLLPPLLAATLLAVFWLCGRLLGSPWLGVLAAAASSSALYLYSRTCLGFFDTDCLNPVFMLLAPFMLYLFTMRRSPWGVAWLAAFAAVMGLFFWWWPQGATVACGLSLLAYALSFPVPSARWERWFKLVLLVVMVTAGVSLVLEFFGAAHTGIDAFQTIVAHVRLILSGGQAAAVGGSIQELVPQLPSSVFLDLAAFPGALLPAEIGLLALIAIRRRFALFLLPLLVFASASVFSQRFMIFTPPLYGLGYGYFFVLLSERVAWVRERAWARGAVLAVLAIMLVPSFARNLAWHSEPPITSRELPLAKAVKEGTNPGATVWAWWDYGYFLQYFAERRTVADGGLATDASVRALAAPLAAPDPVLAARWMRFLAGRGMASFEALVAQHGGPAKAGKILASSLAEGEASEYLKPTPEVCLYLNRNTIDLAYWWYTFGTETLRGPGSAPAELVDRQSLAAFDVDYAGGVFTRRADRASLKVAEVVDVRPAGIARYPADPAARAAAVVYREEGLVYFVARELLDTLAFRLLYAPLGEGVSGYAPLYRDPVAGGVWLVAPERAVGQ
ncbi:MAG: STT3 domain-containing protein [Thermodesulfobacteriota bacterium]